MRLLVVASMYPHPGLPYSGIFIRNCVEAAQRCGHELVVLVPRPYLPTFLSVHPRWAAYAKIPAFVEHRGVKVYRPKLFQVPRFGMTFQRNVGSFLQMRRFAKRLHRRHNFDAVFSFDLSGAGGLAFRLGNYLGIPSTGWTFGLDVRVPLDSADARELREMLNRLDLVYYQSSELRDCAEGYLAGKKLDRSRHIVLPHGIPPLSKPEPKTRKEMRRKLGISDLAILVLFLSRVVKGKGIQELLAAFALAAKQHPQLECIAVGETPGFDDSQQLRTRVAELELVDRFRLLPACKPEQVSDYHACADIFAFPSKSEGMPNALLEAMSLGTPCIVFDIPPIMNMMDHGDCLWVVKSFDAVAFGNAISKLATSADTRSRLAEKAKKVVDSHYDITRNVGEAINHLSKLIA